jgi:hypothetical protein
MLSKLRCCVLEAAQNVWRKAQIIGFFWPTHQITHGHLADASSSRVEFQPLSNGPESHRMPAQDRKLSFRVALLFSWRAAMLLRRD